MDLKNPTNREEKFAETKPATVLRHKFVDFHIGDPVVLKDREGNMAHFRVKKLKGHTLVLEQRTVRTRAADKERVNEVQRPQTPNAVTGGNATV